MSNKEIPSSLHTIEIFTVEEETGRPLAFSMDPDATQRERLKLIVNAQIDRVNPKTFFVNVGGVYDEISSSEFRAISSRPANEIKDFVEELISVFKGPYTSDIILCDPPQRK